MEDDNNLAEAIAHYIENLSQYLKENWKSIVVLIWMVLVTIMLMKQQKTIDEASSYNQVANVSMATSDIRYSVQAMETNIEKIQHSISSLDNTVEAMEMTVDSINTQIR